MNSLKMFPYIKKEENYVKFMVVSYGADKRCKIAMNNIRSITHLSNSTVYIYYSVSMEGKIPAKCLSSPSCSPAHLECHFVTLLHY